MICLRCGNCCLTMLIPIIIDPDKPTDDGNITCLDGTERCPHLTGNKAGEHGCKIHNHPAYKGTPCDQFTQIGKPNDPCRTGEYLLKRSLT